MSWSTPRTWTAGELATASLLNTHLRDQLDFLKVMSEWILLVHTEAQNTGGGTATSGAWETPTLNTEVLDDYGRCTLASNQFTLAAGKYLVIAIRTIYEIGGGSLRLYNVSDTAVVGTFYGFSANSAAADSVTALMVGVGYVDISTSKTFRLEARPNTTKATSGYGVASNQQAETYAAVLLVPIDQ